MMASTEPISLPETPTARDRALALEGWQRRFVAPPHRLFELVELYNSLGLEVRLEPVLPEEMHGECTGCTLALSLFQIVYTRRQQ
jgi:hypothetical protein